MHRNPTQLNPNVINYMTNAQTTSNVVRQGCQSPSSWLVMERIDVVINCTPIRVKIKSKHTILMKIIQTEWYNGKYESNPQEIREISDDLFEFDQTVQ